MSVPKHHLISEYILASCRKTWSTTRWSGPDQVFFARIYQSAMAITMTVAYAGSDQFIVAAVTGSTEGKGRKTTIQHEYIMAKMLTAKPYRPRFQGPSCSPALENRLMSVTAIMMM